MERNFKIWLFASVALGCLAVETFAMDEDNHQSSPRGKIAAQEKAAKNVQKKSEQLQKAFAQIDTEFDKILISQDKITCIMGTSGVGKSTLFNYLLNVPLHATKNPKKTGFTIEVRPEYASKSEIGTGVVSTTTFPKIVNNYCDFAGFRSTDTKKNKATVQDIINSYSIYKLLNKTTEMKILFVASEDNVNNTGNFIPAIQQLAGMFPTADSITPGLSFVLTKRRDTVSLDEFQNQLKAIFQDPNLDLKGNAREIANFLSNPDNQQRISFFDKPKKLGNISFEEKEVIDNKTQISKSIDNASFLKNLTPKFSVTEEAMLLLENLTSSIVQQIVSIASVFEDEADKYCTEFMENKIHENLIIKAEGFRNEFRNFSESLNTVIGETDFIAKARKFQKLLEKLSLQKGEELSKLLDPLEFFNLNSPELLERACSLSHFPLFSKILKELKDLSAVPKFDSELCTLKGHIIGASDLNQMATDNIFLQSFLSGYTLRLLGHSPSENSLTSINQGEVGLYYKNNDELYYKFHGKESIRIDNPLASDGFKRILSNLKRSSNVIDVGTNLITTDDMQELILCLARHGDTISKLIIESKHSIFFDEDITAPGGTLSLDAPHWFVIGNNKKISLKGSDGKEHDLEKAINGSGYDEAGKGNDGYPGYHGLPGESGGKFFGTGRKFYNRDNLKINVDGGNGGKGQNGGNGDDGQKGDDGNFEDVKNRNENSLVSRVKLQSGDPESDNIHAENSKWVFTLGNKKFREIYRSGSEGKSGGNPGEAGKGGNPGKPGIININEAIEHGKYGEKGDEGTPGEPGKKGTDGIAYQGTYINEYILAEMRSIEEFDTTNPDLQKSDDSIGKDVGLGTAEMLGGAGIGVGIGAGAGAGTAAATIPTVIAVANPVGGVILGGAAAGLGIGAAIVGGVKVISSAISAAVSSYWEVEPHKKKPFEENIEELNKVIAPIIEDDSEEFQIIKKENGLYYTFNGKSEKIIKADNAMHFHGYPADSYDKLLNSTKEVEKLKVQNIINLSEEEKKQNAFTISNFVACQEEFSEFIQKAEILPQEKEILPQENADSNSIMYGCKKPLHIFKKEKITRNDSPRARNAAHGKKHSNQIPSEQSSSTTSTSTTSTTTTNSISSVTSSILKDPQKQVTSPTGHTEESANSSPLGNTWMDTAIEHLKNGDYELANLAASEDVLAEDSKLAQELQKEEYNK